MNTTSQGNSTINNQIKKWFDDIIATLRKDQVLYETDLLDEEKKQMYDTIISGDETQIHQNSHNQAQIYFIKNMLFNYLKELKDRNALPVKLAMDISKSKILVWAEIADDDEKIEDELILAEAKVNHKYYPYGFSIASTIVEKSDNLPIPPHYETIIQ